MPAYKNIECLGYHIFDDQLEKLELEERLLVNTINQYSFCVAENDGEFKHALRQSDILLPDGVGIVWASKFLNGKSINKITGAGLHSYLLKELDERSGSCFYLGASDKTLHKIEERILKDYPNIQVGCFSPPFNPEFSDEESQIMVQKVNEFSPDVLFVGMTAPKQEKWTYSNKENLNAGLICSIGAVFDFYAGTRKRPNTFWVNLGLEWLGRLIKEPKRMWKRYIYYGAVFSYYLMRERSKTFFRTST